ncbi:MAG: hypothetical protein M1825_005295 [Sarcosagium campestre]|nr:MAG: hypothetical protein M1825_005295 [Sarcosagium campestre]
MSSKAARAVSAKFPLTKRLYDASRLAGKTRKDKARVDIVSSSLCGACLSIVFSSKARRQCPPEANGLLSPDDTIARLAPSLVRHKNCDIIDMNPGSGLWSSRLHDHLKPRTHILMEPAHEYYAPFLKPLLKQRGSTYRLFPQSGSDWSSFQKLMTEDYLPHQHIPPIGDKRQNEANDSLLFVANIGRHANTRHSHLPSLTHKMIYQLLVSVYEHTTFQAYGLVRMLIWMNESQKRALLPGSVVDRRKFSVQAEASTKELVEVAGIDGNAGPHLRLPALELESSINVVKRMQSGGIKTADKRKLDRQRQAEGILSATGDQEKSAKQTSSIPLAKELAELERGFADGAFYRYVNNFTPEDARKKRKGLPRAAAKPKSRTTPQYARLTRLRSLAEQKGKDQMLMDKVLAAAAKMRSIEQLIRTAEGFSDESLRQLEDRLSDARTEYALHYGQMSAILQARALMNLDDGAGFGQDPPLLVSDRRPFEPLAVDRDEFYPREALSLVDIVPKALPATIQARESLEIFQYILGHVFTQPSQSLTDAFESLLPGAAEAIIPKVPALHDPARGGVTDIKDLRVRMLTVEMVEGMVEAWQRWPFKPGRMEMLASMAAEPTIDDDSMSRLMPTSLG